nr:hypothetical protein BaRGS_033585 [Batillaria attramentaria]
MNISVEMDRCAKEKSTVPYQPAYTLDDGEGSVIRLFEPAGTITSPNYPDDYPNNALRVFVINPPGPEKVCLNFTDFRL